MALFTIVMDLSGGTYVSQVKAETVAVALREWALRLEYKQIKGLGHKLKKRIIQQLEKEPGSYEPVQLNEINNVWHTLVVVWGRAMFINLVKTVE